MNFVAVTFSTFIFLFLYLNLLFSSSAKDLIRGLLRTDPQNRFTVEQVVNNPWIKVNTLGSMVHQYFKVVFPQHHKVHVYYVASLSPPRKHFCICRDNLLTRVENLTTKQTGITRLSVCILRRPWDIVARNSYCKNVKTNGASCENNF